MNILQVTPYFAPAWAYGGPPRVVYELSRELVRAGHSVTVLTTDALAIDQSSQRISFFFKRLGLVSYADSLGGVAWAWEVVGR